MHDTQNAIDSYMDASLRRVCKDGEIGVGISFRLKKGGVVYLRLTTQEATATVAALQQALYGTITGQSPIGRDAEYILKEMRNMIKQHIDRDHDFVNPNFPTDGT